MSPARQSNRSPRRRGIARQTSTRSGAETKHNPRSPNVARKKRRDFDLNAFLATIGAGRKVVAFARKQNVFTQGDDRGRCVLCPDGQGKLTVLSKTGKEATIGILGESDFFGEACLAGQTLRMMTATAMTDCDRSANRQEGHDAGTSPGTRVF